MGSIAANPGQNCPSFSRGLRCLLGQAQMTLQPFEELERMRGDGSSFLAFAWPAFWWFDHYRGFAGYLRSTFPCLLSDELLVVLDSTISPKVISAV